MSVFPLMYKTYIFGTGGGGKLNENCVGFLHFDFSKIINIYFQSFNLIFIIFMINFGTEEMFLCILFGGGVTKSMFYTLVKILDSSLIHLQNRLMLLPTLIPGGSVQ